MQPKPAALGDPICAIDTPALIVYLDLLERNVARLAELTARAGLALRPHAKAHKCPELGRLQIARGAVGLCCQKLSEAEIMVDGGVGDILITNEIVADRKVDRLAALAERAAVAVCVDDHEVIGRLGAAAAARSVRIRVLVEIDVGQGRCGVPPGKAAVPLAEAIAAQSHLTFGGLQAYHGRAQHFRTPEERAEASRLVADHVLRTVDLLRRSGLRCETVSGGGTGTFPGDIAEGALTELQAGSYIFMDADYRANRERDGGPFSEFAQSLLVKATVVSRPVPQRAVIDAGLKALSIDSGLPLLRDHPGIAYGRGGDEHGILALPDGAEMRIGDPVWLIPSHCDTTVNLYDWFVGTRGDRVEALWPIAGRGAVA